MPPVIDDDAELTIVRERLLLGTRQGHDERSVEASSTLHSKVSMVEVSPSSVNLKAVGERLSRVDRALRHVRCAVVVWSPSLQPAADYLSPIAISTRLLNKE